MERLDRFDEEQAEWEAKKLFVNTVRSQTLMPQLILQCDGCWNLGNLRLSISLHFAFQLFLDVHVAQGWTDLQIAKWTAKCWNHSPAGHLIAVPNVRCHDFRNLELCWNWPRAPATKDWYHWKLNNLYMCVDYQLYMVICSHIMIERGVWMKFLGISEIHLHSMVLYGSPDTMVGCHSEGGGRANWLLLCHYAMAITIGAIAGCDGCSYGCHCWLLLLGAIAWGAMAGVSHGAGCHARGGIAGTVAGCHGGVPLRRHFGVKYVIRCQVRALCFGVEKTNKIVYTIWGLCWIFCLFLDFFLLSFPRCIGHMRPSSPAWARSQSKRCERCEYGKNRVVFKGQFRKVVFSRFSIAHFVYHCFIRAFGFYMSTSHTWHLHKHYTKQSYGRCTGVNPSTAHHLT